MRSSKALLSVSANPSISSFVAGPFFWQVSLLSELHSWKNRYIKSVK